MTTRQTAGQTMGHPTGQITRQVARGAFITLEGVDGAGKSTHTDWLVAQLRSAGVPVLCTREPGGTPLGERLRALLLSEPMRAETEALLMFAARSEHIAQVIEPALAAGTWVVCDRYLDASYAYQGGGRELGAERVTALAAWLGLDAQAYQPDLTWVFDVPLELARARAARARAPDRFERAGAAFFARTRAAYQARAGQFPARIRLIDATRSIAAIRQELAAHLHALLAVHPGGRQGERA